jgi:hypothetical protein
MDRFTLKIKQGAADGKRRDVKAKSLSVNSYGLSPADHSCGK